MGKKIIVLFLIIISIFLITGCRKNNADAKKFSEEYEKLNNTKAPYGDNENYRNISIPKNNSFVYSNAKEILEMIDNKETFYVYFGSAHCPWCRSVIEKAVEVANKNKVEKIYYVNIWKGFHEEILRDTYEIGDNNKPNKVKDGSKEYYKLLNKFDNLLEDYTLTTDNNEKINVGEKRIFAPNFIYVEKGKAKKIITGISKKQTKYNSKLNKNILADEEKKFNNFFKKYFKNIFFVL